MAWEVKQNHGIACSYAGDVVLMVWRDPARVPAVRQVYEWLGEAAALCGTPILCFQIVLSTSSPPDGPARQENHTRLKTIERSLRRIVTVPLGGVMWGNVVRTIMRGMFLITGQSALQRVASSEKEGMDVLLELASARTPSRAELESGLEALYKSLGVSRPAA